MHTINSPQVRKHLQNIAGGTTRQRVSGGNLKRLALPTPRKAMQQRIVTRIDSLADRSKSVRGELGHIPALVNRYDLTKATRTAIQEMVDFLMQSRGMSQQAAYQLTSIAGNVAVTQLVDGKVGVHVKMPKGVFTGF